MCQTRSRGVSQVLSPVVDVSRDPRWGRVEETFGEDPFLVARMGVAAVNGFQGRRASADAPIDGNHVMATLKHMTGYYTLGGRNAAPGIAPPRMLREVFLLPFEAAIREAHALSVMASYNEIDGVPSHENHWLLTDLAARRMGLWRRGGVRLHRGRRSAPHASCCLGSGGRGRLALEVGVDIELPEPRAIPRWWRIWPLAA